MSKPGVTSVGVIKKGAVAINVSLSALVEDMSNSGCVEQGSKLSASCVLNAMHGPENLFDSVEDDAISRPLTLVICGEAAVVRWMPIFGRDNKAKVPLQFVGEGNDFIAMRHRQGAAGQKVILQIYYDQRLHFAFVVRRHA